MRLILAAGLLFLQSADAPEEGKPIRCDNFFTTPAAHRCACGKAMHHDCSQPTPDVAQDKRCTTYCREQNCHCVNQCSS